MRFKRFVSELLAVSMVTACCASLGIGAPVTAAHPKEASTGRMESPGSMAVIDDSGGLWMWGRNDCAQIGKGIINGSVTKAYRVMPDVKFKLVETGRFHTAAIDTSGSLWVWGYNEYGQCGTGEVSGVVSTPRKVLTHVKDVKCGDKFTLALAENGNTYFFGAACAGIPQASSPTVILENVKDISCSSQNIACVTRDNEVYVEWDDDWGFTDSSAMENGLVLVASGYTDVEVGLYYAVVLAEDGSVCTFGSNEYGQAGNGVTSMYPSATIVDTGVDAESIVVGGGTVYALTGSGDVYSWGDNSEGQCGYSGGTYTPNRVCSNARSVMAGEGSALILLSDGTCRGYGILQDGSGSFDRIAVHGGTALGVRVSGEVVCWGKSSHGQCGSVAESRDATVIPLDTVVSYCNGNSSEDVIVTDGSLLDVNRVAERDGWEFVGWSLYPDSKVVLTRYTVNGGATVYAVFKKQITVAFRDYSNVRTIKHDIFSSEPSISVTAPGIQSRVGWSIRGWSKSPSVSAEIDCSPNDEVQVSEDCIFYASWEQNTVVNFYYATEKMTKDSIRYSGTGADETEFVTTMPALDEIHIPDGWTALGWAEGVDSWEATKDFSEEIRTRKDTDFYLLMQKNVTLDYDYGDDESKFALWNSSVQVPAQFILKDADKMGYRLSGWMVGDERKGAGELLELLDSASANAVWNIHSYVMEFEGNGATDGDPFELKAVWDEPLRMPKNPFSLHHRIELDAAGGECASSELTVDAGFGGWMHPESGTLYKEYQKVSNLTEKDSVLFQAQWVNTKVTLPNPKKSGYTFAGWTDGSKMYTGEIEPMRNMKLKAVWNSVNGNVTIDYCGATSVLTSDKVTLVIGEKGEALGDPPVREYVTILDYGAFGTKRKVTSGYQFMGLYSQKDCKGTQYFDAELRPLRKWNLNGNVTLYAGWAPVVVKLPSFAAEGYSYEGWSDGSDVYKSEYTPVADRSLSLVMKAAQYSVVLNANGGRCDKDGFTYTSGQSIDLPAAMRKGYVFLGWYDGNGQPVKSITAETKGNLVLTARWLEITSDNSLQGDESLKDAVFPNGAQEIPDGYFKDCINMESAVIPDGVIRIGDEAFAGCTSLKNVYIPDSVTYIGKYAFKDCTALKEILMPESVTFIGMGAFSGCTSLRKATVLNPACTIEGGMRTFPNGVVLYGYSPSTLEQYAKEYGYKFVAIGQAYEIKIDDGFGVSRVLYTLKQLPMQIDVPALTGNSKDYVLNGFVLKSSVTALNTVFAEGTVVYDSNGYKMLEGIDASMGIELVAKWQVKDGGKNPGNNTCVPNDSPSVAVYYRYGKNVTLARAGKDKKVIIVPNAVTIDGKTYKITKIGKNAFKGYRKVKKVVIGNSVTAIGAGAFQKCTNLTTVILGKKVRTVGKRAFYGDRKLKLVKASAKKVSIGRQAFKGTAKRLVVKVPKRLRGKYRKYTKWKGNKRIVVK